MGRHHKCHKCHDKCKCHKDKDCRCRPASIDTKCVLADVVNATEVGNSIVADPNTAVGPEQLVTAVNLAVEITDKKTGERLSLTQALDFWNITLASHDSFISDPVVLFDEFTNRFIALMWEPVGFFADAELSVESPGSIAGIYPASKGLNEGSQDPFDLSGIEIVPAVPLNADTPLMNDLTGKIALISSDGFVATSAVKGNNAAAAGAVAAIIFNTDVDLFGDSLLLIFGSDFIPTISVSNAIGEAMLANSPGVVGGMRSLPVTEVGLNSFSRMHFAVSKDATPKTADDFITCYVGDEDGPYKNLLADYPKLGIDEDAVYISTNSIEFPIKEDDSTSIFQQIVAIEKAPLIEGAWGPLNVLLNNLLLIDPSAALATNEPSTLRLPTFLRPPKSNGQQVAFFVNVKVDDPNGTGPANGDALVVTAITKILSGDPQISTFEVPVEPWEAASLGFPPDFEIRNQGAPQPPGIFQQFGVPLFRLANLPVRMMYRCVQFKDSLWCTLTIGGPDLFEVRWYELDVSNFFDLANPRITLKQEGKIIPGGTTSAFYPSIDVDKDGNMGIGFNISGPDQLLSFAHTGRLCTDPKGTVRFPLQVNLSAQPDFPYYNGSIEFPTFNSRWNDYTSCVLDPLDHKTFWFTSQYSNLDPSDYFAGIPNWKAGIVNFCVEEGKGKTRTKPGQKGKVCPVIPKEPVSTERGLEITGMTLENMEDACCKIQELAVSKKGKHGKKIY